MKRYSAFLLMLGNVLLVAILTWTNGKLDESTVAGVLTALLLTVLAFLLLARPQGWVATIARGYALAFLICFAGFMVVFFFAYLMTEYKSNFSMRWDELALLLSIVGIQVGLLRVLRPPAGHAAAAVPTAAAAVGALFSLGAIFYVSTVLNATVPILFEIPFLRADSVMMTSIPRVQACAVAYAKRTGQVPRTLGVMGPPPTGSGCLDEQYASGKIGRVSLEYRAQDSTRYSVVARVEREDRERSRMATGDQSGILRGGSAHDTLGFHVLSGSMNLVRGTRACAEYVRARAGGNSYPENPNEAYTGRSESDTQDDLLRLGCGWIPGKWGTQVWETWKYTPVRDSGRIVDYMVEVRPAVYGVRGVRSFKARAHGPVYFTLENRPATETDSIMPECEYEYDLNCASEPGGIRADVVVEVADTITTGAPFPIQITDRREGTATPYQYRVECGQGEFYYGPTKAISKYNFEPTQYCTIPAVDYTGGLGSVRVWIRDRGGHETTVRKKFILRRSPG